MRVFQAETTQCKAEVYLAEGPMAALEWARGTVGRGEVSFRRGRGTRLCGPLRTTVRHLVFIGSEIGASDRFRRRMHDLT